MIDGINIILNPDVSDEDRERILEMAECLIKIQKEIHEKEESDGK